MYHVLLLTGWLPLVMVCLGFAIWAVTSSALTSNMLSMIFIAVFGLLLINAFFLFTYYQKARKQNNPQALSRTLLFIGLLLANIVTDIFVYNYISYSKSSNAITIYNKSNDVAKKIFFTNGTEKYFVTPVEPKQSIARAIVFSPENNVKYTFDLKGKTISGVLMTKEVNALNQPVSMKIYTNGRVVVEQHKSAE